MPTFTIEAEAPAGPGDLVWIVVEEDTIYDTKDCPLCEGSGKLVARIPEIGSEENASIELPCPGNPFRASMRSRSWDCDKGKVYSTEREHIVLQGDVRSVEVSASGFRPRVRLLVAWKSGIHRDTHQTHTFNAPDIYTDKAKAEREALRANRACHC